MPEETEVKLSELELKTLIALTRHQADICHKVSAYSLHCNTCNTFCLMADLRDKLRAARKKLQAK